MVTPSDVEMILRRYHAYQSVSVAVDKKLPWQREGSNSQDLFTDAVTTGKLIVGHEIFLQFAWCSSTTKQVIFLLIYWICGSCSTHQQEIFGGKKFCGNKLHKLVFDRENCKNFCLIKISCYTTWSAMTWQWHSQSDLASGVHLHPSTEEEDHILKTALPTCPDQSLWQLI